MTEPTENPVPTPLKLPPDDPTVLFLREKAAFWAKYVATVENDLTCARIRLDEVSRLLNDLTQ